MIDVVYKAVLNNVTAVSIQVSLAISKFLKTQETEQISEIKYMNDFKFDYVFINVTKIKM